MNPNQIRGYRFFLPDAPNNIDSDLYLELQLQLYVAISFVVLGLIVSFVKAQQSGWEFESYGDCDVMPEW